MLLKKNFVIEKKTHILLTPLFYKEHLYKELEAEKSQETKEL